MTAVVLALLVPQLSASSGATVGGFPFLPGAVTASSAAATAESGEAVRSRPKCSAHRAVRFYQRRYAEHLAKMGADSAPDKKAPGTRKGSACPRYLAQVWKRKAYAARVRLERWERSIGRVVARLERGLRGTPMAGTGILLERYGRRYGVSPYFMVAVAATESSIGRVACSNNHRNVWGLASCVNSWPVPYFDTWDEAISFYARFLTGRWPGHSTPYSFRGYAACSDCWARKVSYWMSALFGVPARTVYP